MKTYFLKKGNYSSPPKHQPGTAEACLQRQAQRRVKPRLTSSAGFISLGFMPQQGLLHTGRAAERAAGPRRGKAHSTLLQALSICSHTSVSAAISSGRMHRKQAGKSTPKLCSRTQDLRANYASSLHLGVSPCGFPQCVKSYRGTVYKMARRPP